PAWSCTPCSTVVGPDGVCSGASGGLSIVKPGRGWSVGVWAANAGTELSMVTSTAVTANSAIPACLRCRRLLIRFITPPGQSVRILGLSNVQNAGWPDASTDLNIVQPAGRYLHLMDAATITSAALDTMAEVGLDRLTMRAVAARLGVHVGGLYYYLPDKTTLLRSMADQICLQIMDATTPTGDWRLDALDLCHATRRTLLERRDATRVFAQSPVVASVGAVSLLERMLTLLATGIKPDRVAPAADTLLSYVTGFTLQEQLGT